MNALSAAVAWMKPLGGGIRGGAFVGPGLRADPPGLRLPLLLAACLAIFCVGDAVRAQQPAEPRRIGVLTVGFLPQSGEAQRLLRGLQDAGYVEGRDVVLEWRSAEGDYSRVQSLAADLVQRKVDVIVVESTIAAQAVKHATVSIPIVMAIVADPVGSGLVTSLAHPGGNLTGLSLMGVDLSAKRLQLLKEAIPRLARVAVLWNPATPFHGKSVRDIKTAARALSINVTLVAAQRPADFGPALSAAKQAHAQALYVVEDPVFTLHRKRLLDITAKARLPSIYSVRDFPDDGGFISYGADLGDMFRRSAQYVDRILKGAKPGDLPIQQPTRFELVINLKTAQALGLAIPESILLQADEVIR